MSLVPHTSESASQRLAIAGPVHPDIQAAISQALAAQNEAHEAKLKARDEMIDKLMNKLEDVTIGKQTSSSGTSRKKSTPVHPSTSTRTAASRAVSKPPPSASKVKARVKAAAAKPTTTPPRKQPHQVRLDQYPPGFEKTKTAFETHIRVLWGMLKVKSVPPAADPASMQFFAASYDDLEAVKRAIDDAATPQLVALNQIQTLRDATMGQIRVGRGMISLDQQAILAIHGALSKAGLALWAPDLTQSHDALYNAAHWYIAISTFREVSVGPSYRYLQVNPKFVDDIATLTIHYNHYVHFLSLGKFKREVKSPGRLAEVEAVKSISQRRRRLAESRSDFAKKHNLPKRYKLILSQPYAHSDDELDSENGVYVIKTLGYRSQNANKFFRRLDSMMNRVSSSSGKAPQKAPRLLPMEPQPSRFLTPPFQLPLHYYKPSWFNALTPSQKEETVKHNQVALLPNATESLIPPPNAHPAKKMRGRDFNKKYYDRLSSPYQINSPAGDSDSDDGDGPLYANRPVHEEDMSDSIDLMAPSEGSDAEDKAINKLYFTSGDFGDLYEESKEDGDYTPGEDEDSEDDGGQNGKNAQVPFDTIGDQPMQE